MTRKELEEMKGFASILKSRLEDASEAIEELEKALNKVDIVE